MKKIIAWTVWSVRRKSLYLNPDGKIRTYLTKENAVKNTEYLQDRYGKMVPVELSVELPEELPD